MSNSYYNVNKYKPKNERAATALRKLIDNKIEDGRYKSRIAFQIAVKSEAIQHDYNGLIFHIPYKTIVPFLEKELFNVIKRYQRRMYGSRI